MACGRGGFIRTEDVWWRGAGLAGFGGGAGSDAMLVRCGVCARAHVCLRVCRLLACLPPSLPALPLRRAGGRGGRSRERAGGGQKSGGEAGHVKRGAVSHASPARAVKREGARERARLAAKPGGAGACCVVLLLLGAGKGGGAVESHVADHEAHSPICSSRASPIYIPLNILQCGFGDPSPCGTSTTICLLV